MGGLYESRAAFWLKREYETTKAPRTQRAPSLFIVVLVLKRKEAKGAENAKLYCCLLLNRRGVVTQSFIGDQGPGT